MNLQTAGTYKDGYEGRLQVRKGDDFHILVDRIRGKLLIFYDKLQ